MDASVDLAAAMEVVTLAPGLADIPVGADDSFASAVERIFPVVNGPMGVDNPQRQGFNSALAGEGGPLNTLGGIPTIATDYSFVSRHRAIMLTKAWWHPNHCHRLQPLMGFEPHRLDR
jgi:hypothetical protein